MHRRITSTRVLGRPARRVIIEKMVLPRILQRDLATTLDNLAEIAAVELTD